MRRWHAHDNDEIATLIDQVFESVADTLQKERYLFGVGKILPLVNKADPRAKWANGGTVTKTIKAKLEQVLGQETNGINGKKKTRQREGEEEKCCSKQKGGKSGKAEEKQDYAIPHQISFAKPLMGKVSATRGDEKETL